MNSIAFRCYSTSLKRIGKSNSLHHLSFPSSLRNIVHQKVYFGSKVTDDSMIAHSSTIATGILPNYKPTKIISSISSDLNLNGFTSSATSSKIPILSPSLCDILKQTTIPNLFEGNFDTGCYPDEWHWRKGISRDDAAREMCNSWKSSRMIASIVLNEQLGRFVADCMGWDCVRLSQDDIVWKPPQLHHHHQTQGMNTVTDNRSRIDTVGFHQDSAYISVQFEPYQNNSVTVWIALDDADEENGCLEYAVGSHQWKPILHNIDDHQEQQQIESEALSSFHNSDESSYRNGVIHAAMVAGIGVDDMRDDDDDDCKPVKQTLHVESVPVKMGHAILHHQDVWHGSGPNLSTTRHRRALVAHYLRGDIQFVNDHGVDGCHKSLPPFGRTSYIYGRYKRYKQSELDETFFPVVYGNTSSQLQRTEWVDDYILHSIASKC